MLLAPGESGVRITSTDELEREWGDSIRHLAQEQPTAYLLCQALRKLSPPILVSDAIAGRWLRDHGGVQVKSKADSAGHLEMHWGARIREHLAGGGIEPGALANWMLTTLGVSVPTRVCQTWLTRDWASSGKLLLCQDVEAQLGDRLRLAEYMDRFFSMMLLRSFSRRH